MLAMEAGMHADGASGRRFACDPQECAGAAERQRDPQATGFRDRLENPRSGSGRPRATRTTVTSPTPCSTASARATSCLPTAPDDKRGWARHGPARRMGVRQTKPNRNDIPRSMRRCALSSMPGANRRSSQRRALLLPWRMAAGTRSAATAARANDDRDSAVAESPEQGTSGAGRVQAPHFRRPPSPNRA